MEENLNKIVKSSEKIMENRISSDNEIEFICEIRKSDNLNEKEIKKEILPKISLLYKEIMQNRISSDDEIEFICQIRKCDTIFDQKVIKKEISEKLSSKTNEPIESCNLNNTIVKSNFLKPHKDIDKQQEKKYSSHLKRELKELRKNLQVKKDDEIKQNLENGNSKRTKGKRNINKENKELELKKLFENDDENYSSLNLGYTPEKILKTFEIDGALIHLVKFKRIDQPEIIESSELALTYPYILINYYERKVYFRSAIIDARLPEKLKLSDF